MTPEQALLAEAIALAVDESFERLRWWRLNVEQIEHTLAQNGLRLVAERIEPEDPFA